MLDQTKTDEKVRDIGSPSPGMRMLIDDSVAIRLDIFLS